MTHRVILSMGSNTRPEENMASASEMLANLLDTLRLTRVIWTDDIHGRGIKYLNRLVSGFTVLTVDELNERLKQIEQAHGRTREHITIDLDLMLYDDQRYHERDWPRPYIQQLINDIL